MHKHTQIKFAKLDICMQNICFIYAIVDRILTENADLGIIYDDKRNGGRLPSYHRLDASLKKSWNFTKFTSLEAVVSVTNAYDRSNIFYFDRTNYTRVNQLPILPSVGLTFKF